jgi:hypothetical protein
MEMLFHKYASPLEPWENKQNEKQGNCAYAQHKGGVGE